MKQKYLRKNVLAVLAAIGVIAAAWIPGQWVDAADNKPSETNRMQPDHAPTPFSAEEIRQGCPRGRKIVFQVEAFGKQLVFQTLKFTSTVADQAVFETVTTGMDGKQMGKKRITTGKWQDLQAHASFPEAQTRIRPESLTTPAGTFDCWLYEITLEKDGKNTVQRFWFAKKLPGPPLCFEEKLNGQLAYKMTMLKTGR